MRTFLRYAQALLTIGFLATAARADDPAEFPAGAYPAPARGFPVFAAAETSFGGAATGATYAAQQGLLKGSLYVEARQLLNQEITRTNARAFRLVTDDELRLRAEGLVSDYLAGRPVPPRYEESFRRFVPRLRNATWGAGALSMWVLVDGSYRLYEAYRGQDPGFSPAPLTAPPLLSASEATR